MSLVPTVYRSTDPGAPVLNGQAGSLIALLHAVLVTGYGTGQTAKAGAGWTRPYSNAGVHVYRNSTVNGSGAYLRVRDDASADTLNTGRLAQAWAYSSMSDIDTGTDKTPNPDVQARGSMIAKSPDTTAGARGWMVVATEIGFYLFTAWGQWNNAMGAYYYGDIISSVSGDVYPFVTFGSSNLNSFSGGWSDEVCSVFFASTLEFVVDGVSQRGSSYIPGGFVMRSYSDGQGKSGRIATCGVLHATSSSTNRSYGSGAYRVGPDPVHGGFNYMEAMLREAPHALRGKLPGVLVPLHARPHPANGIVSHIDGIGLGQWLAVNYNVAEPDTADRDGQVLFRLDAPWK